MAIESTLLIVKPDGVRRGLIGEVIRRVESKGLTIEELDLRIIERGVAEEHYGEHREKPFFGELSISSRAGRSSSPRSPARTRSPAGAR